MSLKLGLERLLGDPCYHMVEVFSHPEHVQHWQSAALNQMPDWNDLFTGYSAAVDWPASAFWPEISEAFPDAIVVLSVRDSEAWWRSAHETIFARLGSIPNPQWLGMIEDMFEARFTRDITNREACISAFERHNARVREAVGPPRLLEWQASQGWEPLCKALDLPIPDEPFPHVNTREDWAARHAPPQQSN
jgi:hypothetical protein